MKEFQDKMTSLPYHESPEYLDNLIKRCSSEAENRRLRPITYAFAVMAVAAAVTVMAVMIPFGDVTVKESPMTDFLASLSDHEVSMITDFQIEEIPEPL